MKLSYTKRTKAENANLITLCSTSYNTVDNENAKNLGTICYARNEQFIKEFWAVALKPIRPLAKKGNISELE